MTMTTATQSIDVHEMIVIHRVFRRELDAIPALIRGARDGDRSRARVVSDHVRLILDGLHMHHTGEDAVIWPRLLERAPAARTCVETMQTQHRHVAEQLDQVEPALRAWRTSGSAVDGEALAQTVDALGTTLFDHLDLEESAALPLIAQHITAQEWATLGEHGREAMSSRQLPLLFGSILQDATEPERAALLASVPAPIRLYLRTIGARQYRRYNRRLHASQTGAPARR